MASVCGGVFAVCVIINFVIIIAFVSWALGACIFVRDIILVYRVHNNIRY